MKAEKLSVFSDLKGINMANTVYKYIRKNHGFTRDEVCDKAMDTGVPFQPERLERIENGKYPINPEEVLQIGRASCRERV